MSIKDLPIERQRQIQKGKLYALKTKRADGIDIEPEPIELSIPGQGKDGKDGINGRTPIKGIDYFDGKDGYTPIKGVDYFDGKDGKSLQGIPGKDANETKIIAEVLNRIPTPKDGKDGVDGKDGKEPTVEFGTGKDSDRLKINGVVKGPHLTGPQGATQQIGYFTPSGGTPTPGSTSISSDNVTVDASGFGGNLGPTDTDLQKALLTIDQIPISATTQASGIALNVSSFNQNLSGTDVNVQLAMQTINSLSLGCSEEFAIAMALALG